jgi:hypothetical protein
MLAKANAVVGFTGVRVATSARPLTPVQLEPSGKRIVTDTPGIASFTRTRSSVAWSAVRRSWSAVGPGGGAIGDADGPGAVVPVGPAEAPVDGPGAIATSLDPGLRLVPGARLGPGPTLASAAPARPPVV